MKKLSVITFVFVLISASLLAASATAETKQPVSGGVLRIIQASGPQVLSYKPIMGPGDYVATYPGTETLVSTTSERGEMSAGVEPDHGGAVSFGDQPPGPGGGSPDQRPVGRGGGSFRVGWVPGS